jgi:hypothetical protein
MVAVHAASASAQRRIALIKPRFATDEQAGHAVQLFDSVLWFFKGTTRSSWLAAEASDAGVIVVHHSEPAAHLDAWRRAGKIVIKLSTDEANHPADSRTLLYPFPAVKVLSMLERVEAEMDGGDIDAPAPPPLSSGHRRSEDPWSFVEALRTLRTLSNSTLWLQCKGQRGVSLWIQGDGTRYFCDSGTAAAIRAGEIDLSGLTLQKSSSPPDNLAPRVGAELFWFSAYHASAALAPWLEEKTLYRLVRWPDFGRLRASDEVARTAQLRIVAALAYAPASVATVAAHTRTSVEQATRTLNALSSCALIGPARSDAPPPPRQGHLPNPAGGFKQFLRNLRKHLRLGVHP